MTDLGQLLQIAQAAAALVESLPDPVIESVANVLSADVAADWATRRTRIMHGLAHAHYRSVISGFLEDWRIRFPEVQPQLVAASLLTALLSQRTHRVSQTFELVWTGPDVNVIPLRRTEQALLQLINSATQRLTVVSYAVYKIPRIRDALLNAADRGVFSRVLVDTPDPHEGQRAYDTLAALGPSIASRCTVLIWPPEKRDRDDNGKLGILHVKCAVADGRCLFLSSANLTEYAFTLNMELGLLITGGNLPAQVEAHFDQLCKLGVLTKSGDA